MANSCPIKVECIDDSLDRICSVQDLQQEVHSSTYDYLYVRELFEWLEYDTTDWEVVGATYRLVIPRSVHKCTNPFVDSMVILRDGDVKYYPNIPVWHALANDSIVITSDEPIKCKVLIKGEQ